MAVSNFSVNSCCDECSVMSVGGERGLSLGYLAFVYVTDDVTFRLLWLRHFDTILFHILLTRFL